MLLPRFVLAAACLAVGLTAEGGGAESVDLKVDRGAVAAGEWAALGVGVPLKQGMLMDPRKAGIVRRGGEARPSVCEARTRYSDGSVQWLWADFEGGVDDSLQLVVNEAPAAVANPVQVVQNAEVVTVKNGALTFTWNPRFATPTKVESEAGVLAEGDGRGVYLLDEHGARAVLGGPAAGLGFRVETANALRAVLRLEGWYVRDDGERVARAVMRYDIRRGQPSMRVEHHLILTRDNEEVSFREVGITMPLKAGPASRAIFGVKGAAAVAVALDETVSNAFIFQSKYPVYYKTESECLAGSGTKAERAGAEAEGWCDLGDGRAGVVMAVKDFAPQFPGELLADAHGVTAKLWSSRSGMALDYKPARLAKDWWGDWLGRCDKIAPASVDRVTTPAEMAALNPSCVGVARTHELLVGYYAGAQDEARARQWHARFQAPPAVLPDPRWTCHVDPRCFWPMAAAGEGGAEFAEIEEFIAAWLEEFMVPLQLFPYTGWYDWGRQPELRYVKEPAENDRIYAQWWRLSYNNQYQTTKHLMLGWARSGDRRYLDAVRRFDQWQLDHKIIHWSGGRDRKRLGHFAWAGVHQLPSWFAGTGVLGMTGDTEFVTGPALEYLLLDNRWALDSLQLVKAAALAGFRPDPKITLQSPDMSLSYLVGLYRVLPDEQLKQMIQSLFAAITDVDAPVGMRQAFFDAIGSHYTPTYKINRKSIALAEYCDIMGGDETAWKIATKAAVGAAAREAGGNVCNYCEFYGASNARAWQRTDDAQFLEPVRYQLRGVQKFFEYYKALPPEGRLAAHFRTMTPSSPLAQSGPHSVYYFPEAGLKGQDGRPLQMAFTTPTSGVAFLSLPTAIWALMQAAERK